MGVSYIMWLNDDAIRNAADHEPEAAKWRAEIGKSVAKVCLSPEIVQLPEGAEISKSENLFNYSCVVNLAEEVHATDSRLYLWFGNCLRPLHELDDEDLEVAMHSLDNERARRVKNKQS